MEEPLQSPVEKAFDENLPASLTWEQQLVMLRSLSEKTGAVHSAQALQLQYWPFAVDPQLPADGHQEVHVDIALPENEGDTRGRLVQYIWHDPERQEDWKPDEEYLSRLKVLAKWTRWMLGARIRVEVILNDATIFVKDSARKKRKKRKKHRGREGRGSKKRKRK